MNSQIILAADSKIIILSLTICKEIQDLNHRPIGRVLEGDYCIVYILRLQFRKDIGKG